MKQLAIFGFGLVGASIAAAVRHANPSTEIVAIDLPEVISTPAVRALARQFVAHDDHERVQAAAAAADLCVLAAPVSAIAAQLPALLDVARVVTDCGSTKRSICAAIVGSTRARRFVPGHPMAGGPEGGAALARADLFRDQTWLVCPENSDADAVARVEELLQLVGAKSVHLSVAAHDRAVAYTSHVPQLFASALSALAADAGLSRFHFCRAFKESTGLSPHAWLRQQRLERAMNMLRDTDASIELVAAELGYASQTAFTAAFKKLTGDTPTDWRRRIR